MAISPSKAIGMPTNDGGDHSGFLIKSRQLPVSSVRLPLPPLRRPLPVAFEVKPFPQGPPPPLPKQRSRSLSTAHDVLRLMDSLRIPISKDMYAYLLKECIDCRDLVQGTQVHQHMKRNRPRLELALCNSLLLMYAACGRLDIAHNLFDAMLIRDTMSWAIMIVAHSETSDEEALKLFVQMLRRGLEATTLVFVHVLNACVHKSDFRIGEQVHGLVLKTGKYEDSLARSLINFYAKFGCLEDARAIFNQMTRRNTVAWTSLMAGYRRGGLIDQAFEAYKEMRGAGTKKNYVMLSSILRACGQKGCDGRERGRQVHAEAIKMGFESYPGVRNSLVSMYGRCGLPRDARKALEIAPTKQNTACWSALLNCYMLNGYFQDAIELLYEMKSLGIGADKTVVKALREDFGSSLHLTHLEEFWVH